MRWLAYPLAVYAMVIGAFAVGADEFIVAGVVTQISEALSVSIGAVGRLESVYALGVAVGAPVFTLIGLRLPRRLTLVMSLVVFVVGNVISAVGPNYETIMTGRLVSAAAHGAFLGIAALAAGDLVDPARKGRAIALVFTGVTASTVLGAPLGAAVGRALGWRFTFWSMVLLGAVGLILLIVLLPRRIGGTTDAHHVDHAEHHAGEHHAGEHHAGEHHAGEHHAGEHHAGEHGAAHATDPHAVHANHDELDAEVDAHARMHMAQEQSAPIARQLKAVARPPVWLSLLMTMLGYSGVFTSYVYLEPQILEVTGLSSVWVTPLFLLFGLGLFGGNLIGGRLADWKLMPAVLLTIGSLVLMLFVMYFAIQTPLTAVIAVFVYGAAAFSVVTPLQTRIVSKASDAPNVSSAANISALTLGSAIGIWLGGLTIDGGLGAASVNWVGGLLSLSGLAFAIIAWAFVDRRYPEPTVQEATITAGHEH